MGGKMSHNPVNDSNDPVAAWMRQLSIDPPERSHRPLPDPDLVWMKAQLLDRQAAKERALRLVRWFETMARILVVFAAYWLGSALATAVAVPELKLLNPTLLGLAVSVLLAAVTMLAFPIWSED
jgi:hypothetical protein